jgi:c-di-AMP phosphodiesterase-like protein
MIKIIQRIRVFVVIWMLFQAFLLAGTSYAYVNNLYDLQTLLTLPIMITIMGAVVFADTLLVLGYLNILNRERQRNDLKTAEIIGNDVQEAYMYGEIGMVITDESFTVLWTNDLLAERQVNIVDSNILSWRPSLETLVKDTNMDHVRIEFEGKFYDVKFLPFARLFIFKDVTNNETLFRINKAQSPVVGLLVLDNYQEASPTFDEGNEIILSIRKTINDYAEKYGLLLKKFRNDAYIIFTNDARYISMYEDRFTIIQDIRELTKDQRIPITISMGFGLGFPDDILRIYDMAGKATDIAISRGGDQVVVDEYGKDLYFLGGQTLQKERKGGNVKFKADAASVINLIQHSSPIYIVSHLDMDLDGLGACLGIKSIADKFKKESYIIYDPKHTEKKTRMALQTLFSREELLKIVVSPKEAGRKLGANGLVVVVDVHRPSMTPVPQLLEEASKIIVIDHHRRAEEFISNPIVNIIETSATSATELVTEIVNIYNYSVPKKEDWVTIPSSYATIMLAGVFLDSNYFRIKTVGPKTFEASRILKEFGADNGAADQMLQDDFAETSLITKIISTATTPYTGLMLAKSDDKDLIEKATLAKVANAMVQIKEIQASFVIGRIAENMVYISARSDDKINVQYLMEKLSGGGHFTAAATSIKDTTVAQAEARLLEVLEEYQREGRANVTKTGVVS